MMDHLDYCMATGVVLHNSILLMTPLRLVATSLSVFELSFSAFSMSSSGRPAQGS
jgi:hypothetical protein